MAGSYLRSVFARRHLGFDSSDLGLKSANLSLSILDFLTGTANEFIVLALLGIGTAGTSGDSIS